MPEWKCTDLECGMQALRLMAQAYLTRGQPAPALQCVQNVRMLQDALGDSPALCLAALKAHIQACLAHPRPSLLGCTAFAQGNGLWHCCKGCAGPFLRMA